MAAQNPQDIDKQIRTQLAQLERTNEIQNVAMHDGEMAIAEDQMRTKLQIEEYLLQSIRTKLELINKMEDTADQKKNNEDLLTAHQEYLEYFRMFFLTNGSLIYKKEQLLESIVHLEMAIDVFDPKAKQYCDEKKELYRRRAGCEEEIMQLRDTREKELENFKETEDFLNKAGIEFLHPVEENDEEILLRTRKMLEYRQHLAKTEGEKIKAAKENLDREEAIKRKKPDPTVSGTSSPAKKIAAAKADWMKGLPVEEKVREILNSEEITEESFLLLTDVDLKGMGILTGPRKLLLKEISARQESEPKGKVQDNEALSSSVLAHIKALESAVAELKALVAPQAADKEQAEKLPDLPLKESSQPEKHVDASAESS